MYGNAEWKGSGVSRTRRELELEPVLYLPDHLVLRVLGPIDRRAAYALADEVEHGISYYGYRHVDIHIDSPGGEATALVYLVDHIEKWKRRGVVIGTLALGSVASAAAILLSIGSPGHRRVCRHAWLLYHPPRASASTDSSWTAETLDAIAFELRRNAKLVIDALLKAAGDPANPREDRARLKALLEEERWLTPMEVIEHGLADYIEQNRGIG